MSYRDATWYVKYWLDEYDNRAVEDALAGTEPDTVAAGVASFLRANPADDRLVGLRPWTKGEAIALASQFLQRFVRECFLRSAVDWDNTDMGERVDRGLTYDLADHALLDVDWHRLARSYVSFEPVTVEDHTGEVTA